MNQLKFRLNPKNLTKEFQVYDYQIQLSTINDQLHDIE